MNDESLFMMALKSIELYESSIIDGVECRDKCSLKWQDLNSAKLPEYGTIIGGRAFFQSKYIRYNPKKVKDRYLESEEVGPSSRQREFAVFRS